MKRTLLIAAFLAACKSQPTALVAFADRANNTTKLDVAVESGKVHAEAVTVYEPYELRDVTFRGVPAQAVLDSAYGEKWRKSEVISLVALDGYTTTVPVSRLLAHKAWFAFARTDRTDFVLDKKVPKAETVAIAPVYLVWDSVHDAAIRAEGDYGWPYQLASVRLTTFAQAFPGLAPPEHGTSEAAEGFALFTRYCATCHSLDGHGGKVGPELNAPHNVTEYWQPQWLHQWIDNPQSIRKGTAMPGMPAQVPQRQKAIAAVIAYLKAMTHGP